MHSNCQLYGPNARTHAAGSAVRGPASINDMPRALHGANGYERTRAALLSACLSAVLWFAPAANAAIVCDAGVAAVPVLDPLSTAAAVGEFTLDCGGAVGDPIVTANVQSFFNTALASTASPTLTNGLATYAGVLVGVNSVLFSGVLFDPAGALFTLQQILVDATLLSPGAEVFEFVSISGTQPISVTNPNQVVAVVGEVPVAVSGPDPMLPVSVGLLALLALRRRVRSIARVTVAPVPYTRV